MNKIKCKNSNQHKQASRLCKDEKFIRSVPAVGVAPQSNQEIHGYQHHFPKEIKEEEVHRYKNTANTTECPQQIEIEKSGFFFYFTP
jgi:hypothetical protein